MRRDRAGCARRVLWVLAVVATTVNGFVVGYLGAAAVLALAPLALLSPTPRRWAGPAWS